MPMWSEADKSDPSFPITWTYEETTCPCADPPANTVAEYKPNVPDCVVGDSTNITYADGQQYQIQCGTDYLGNDIWYGNLEDDTYKGCLDWCNGYQGCVGIAWVPSRPDNRCCLKDYVKKPVVQTFEVHGAILMQRPEA